MKNWNPITLHPYQDQAWYRLHNNALVIRLKTDCGQLLASTAEQAYVTDFIGVDLATADDDVLQMVTCGVLQDDRLFFLPVLESVQ